MRHFATYFDRNYLLKGVTMIASLHRHCEEPFTVHVVCLDEITRTVIEALGFPHVQTIPLHAIEKRDDALALARGNRSRVEYYWTLTPVVLDWIFEHGASEAPIETLTYLDADLFFFSNPQPIFDELGDRSLLIHEHRFSPDLAHLVDNGRFNVGLMVFRRRGDGIAALDRWREQCLAWCYQRNEDGKMGDQGYLDEWPELYPSLAVLEHPGAGLAPWNHVRYRYGRAADGTPTVDGQRAVFYHFHAFCWVGPGVAVPATHLAYGLRKEILELFFVPYAEALTRSLAAVHGIVPGFRAGFGSAEALSPEHTFIARRTVRDKLGAVGVPQPREELTPSWDVYRSDQLRAPHVEAGPTPALATPPEPAPPPLPASSTAPHRPSVATEPLGAPVGDSLVVSLDRMPRPLVPPSWEGEVVAVGDERQREALAAWVTEGPCRRVVVVERRRTPVERLAVGMTLARGDRIALLHDVPRPLPLDVAGPLVRTSADAIMVDREVLERVGTVDPRFRTVSAALDDLVLRVQAAGLGPRVAPGCLGTTHDAHDADALQRKWGFDPAAIPDAPRVDPHALARVPLPDLARDFEVDRSGTTWVPRAA